MPQWNNPKLMQVGAIAILVAATGAALTWLAQTPGPRPDARAPEPFVSPATAPSIDTPRGGPVLDRPAAPAAALEGEDDGAVVAGFGDDAETVDPASLARTTLWRAIDPDAYSLTPASVPRIAHLPGGYEWPLPTIDRLELICLDGPGQRGHLGIMQTVDGQLFHWAEEHRFLQ